MIRIEKNDTIIDIIGKIKEEKSEDIILVFPFGHPVLHNYISLKIIKNKTQNKKLLIVTSDQTSRKIGRHLGIKYSFIKDDKFYEEASTKEKILKHNFSFWEYFQFEIKHFFRDLWETVIENKNIKYYSLKYSKEQGKIGYFIFGLFVSIVTLFLIFYFAVTKAYITITPEINIKTRGKNFIFSLSEDSLSLKDNVIPLRQISKDVELTQTYATTGVDETKISSSVGEIEIYNYLDEPVKLVPKTRLLTATGVLLETERLIEIPAAKTIDGDKIPGLVISTAHSKSRDNYGKLLGQNANISSGIDVTLPGLKENGDKIFGKTSSNFSGAKDFKQDFIISQEDLENSKNVLETKLKSEALKKVKEDIKKENETNNVTFEILGIDDIIQYSDFEYTLPEGVNVGAKMNNFQLSGSIRIQTYIYNKDAVLSKLKTVVSDSILEGSEKLLLISNDSLRTSTVLYKQESPFEIKATMEIEAFIIHNFLNENDSYVKKLKSTILGLSQQEAQNILLNDPKISNAHIEITPFFVHKIPNIISNIIFKIEENISN